MLWKWVMWLGAALVFVGAGCHRASNLPNPGSVSGDSSVVTFKAADGWTIYADYSAPPDATKAVILLHQRNGSAADWAPLVPKLRAAGVASLAIDQRGSGRSQGAQNGDDAPWDTTPDIAAGVAWLIGKRVKPEHIGLVGASYGANNALIYAAARSETPVVVLLSPGTDYHGRRIQTAAAKYRGALLVISAKNDQITEGGPETVNKAAVGTHEMRLVEGDAHGVQMFVTAPDTLDAITSFLTAHL